MPHAAYIYDAIRTPRSKGKKDGTLHEVKPVDLGAGLLRALQARHDPVSYTHLTLPTILLV